MNNIRKSCLCMYSAFAMLSVSCVSVCLSDHASKVYRRTGSPARMYVVGGMFWIGLISCEILLFMAGRFQRRDAIRKKRAFKKRKPGFLCFFQNREACIADAVLCTSLLSIGLGLIFAINHPLYVWTAIVAFLYSVHLHGVFNGNTYRYLRSLQHKRNSANNTSGQTGQKRKTAVRKHTGRRKGETL